MRNLMLLFISALATSSCARTPGNHVEMQEYQPVESGIRVEVIRLGRFKDDIAYNNERGIYLIKDKETGREYIGVSGVGIAETGSHTNGKSRYEDER